MTDWGRASLRVQQPVAQDDRAVTDATRPEASSTKQSSAAMAE
jgi:hypothetical protein